MYETAQQIVKDMHAAVDGTEQTDESLKEIFMTALEKNKVQLDEEMAELCALLTYGIWCELDEMDDEELASEIADIIEKKPDGKIR